MYGPSLLEKTWNELDAITARIIAGSATEADKGYARGLAFTLSLFMAPHLTTSQDVAREAKKRHDMKAAGEDYETPGLGSRIYEPPPGNNKYSTDAPEKQKIKASKPQPPTPNLTPEQIVAINNAKTFFTSEELAEMYKTTPAFIESL